MHANLGTLNMATLWILRSMPKLTTLRVTTLPRSCGTALPFRVGAPVSNSDHPASSVGMVLQCNLLGYLDYIIHMIHQPPGNSYRFMPGPGLHLPVLANALWPPDAEEVRPLLQLPMD